MLYMILAGEASGDLHGARLIRELKNLDSDARFIFFGGDNMRETASGEPMVHIREMAYMGFMDVLRNLKKVRANLKKAKEAIIQEKPDAIILIDYPSFNLRVAKTAFKNNIPVYYYIPPKVWAWKKWRTKTLLKICKKIFTIFPFENDFYSKYDPASKSKVVYVGNPSVEEVREQLKEALSHDEFLNKYKLRARRPLVALMPGSRKGEIRANLPVMCRAMKTFPGYKPLIIGTNDIPDDFYAKYAEGQEITIIRETAPSVLAHCRGAVVTSGTATLEVALCDVPQVAVYHANGSKLAYNIMKRILKVHFVTLPNLLLDKELIPELLLHECTPENITNQLQTLLRLDSDARKRQLDGYQTITTLLSDNNAPKTAAKSILADLNPNS